MHSKMRKIVLFVALLFGSLAYAAEYTPSTVPDPKKAGQEFYVSNPDNILSAEDVSFLNRCVQDLEKQTKVELCVVAIGSIGEADAFDFSYELFQRWGIGGKNKNTGVLILFVLDSHDLQIRTGTGIEGVLTDAKCSKTMHEDMFPSFRAGNYGEGLCLGALRIYEICTDGEAPEELLNMKSVTNRGKYASSNDEEDKALGMVGMVVGGMAVLFFLIAIWKPRAKCPNCKKRKGKMIKDEIIERATYSHGGNGIRYYKCKKCGHEWSKPYTTSKLTHSSSSGGGSSWSGGGHSGGSWGGGSTSGGGAGGRW